MHSSQENP
jgi:hypothetical protein